jgi:2-amino-4-hydroxy-6-hydroxymethyldihydropteridine diphosphokinase
MKEGQAVIRPLSEMVVIAIGSNVAWKETSSPYATCEAAVKAVSVLPGVTDPVISTWYRTAAIPAGSGPDFVNGVLRIRAEGLEPDGLLADLLAIEARFGRVRSVPNVPRTLDLDLIDFGGRVHAAPDPVLPHPRMHLRAFVLRPLAEIWPDWRHPTLGLSVDALLAALPKQDIEPFG